MFDWTHFSGPYEWPRNSCLPLVHAVCRYVDGQSSAEFHKAMDMTEEAATNYAIEKYGGVLEAYEAVLLGCGWKKVKDELRPFDIVLGAFLYEAGETAPQPVVVREDYRMVGYTEHGLTEVYGIMFEHARMRKCLPQ